MSDEKQLFTNCIAENRFGEFSVNPQLLHEMTDEALRRLYSDFVIVRAEYMYVSGSIRYTAFSPLFKVAPRDTEPTMYSIRYRRDDDGLIVDGVETFWKAER